MLAEGMRAVHARSSSAAAGAAAATATAGMPAPSRGAWLAARRDDDTRMQQLRGVFAAYDGDHDGVLSGQELALALLALGLQPTPDVMAHFPLRATPAAAPTGGGPPGADLPTVRGVGTGGMGWGWVDARGRQ
jgi:hypothetical protein